MKHIILITSDSDNGQALDTLESRLLLKKWEIYQKTNLRRQFEVNDIVLFYIGGVGKLSQHFYGEGIIKNITLENESYSEISNVNIYSTLSLYKIRTYENPVPIKNILNKLNFIKNKLYYGVYLNGGVRIINEKEYELISKYKA
tara:strand:+ start:848 stop:1279 length:432 start_codon:yes stop_codon:yes gene_type:complete